jgi:hypothetical protein
MRVSCALCVRSQLERQQQPVATEEEEEEEWRRHEAHEGGYEAMAEHVAALTDEMTAVKRKNRDKDEVIAKLFLHKNMLEERLAALTDSTTTTATAATAASVPRADRRAGAADGRRAQSATARGGGARTVQLR